MTKCRLLIATGMLQIALFPLCAEAKQTGLNPAVCTEWDAKVDPAVRGKRTVRVESLSDDEAVWNAHSASLAHGEITDDWSQIPLDELESDCTAHLDAFGFRYYIPALMLSVLNHYESSSPRVVGTLMGLYPKKDNSWEYHMYRYSLLNPAQKTAIARFLAALPKLVELDFQDQKVAPRALRNYWGEYLQTNAPE